jgi:hypothetical protein
MLVPSGTDSLNKWFGRRLTGPTWLEVSAAGLVAGMFGYAAGQTARLSSILFVLPLIAGIGAAVGLMSYCPITVLDRGLRIAAFGSEEVVEWTAILSIKYSFFLRILEIRYQSGGRTWVACRLARWHGKYSAANFVRAARAAGLPAEP